MNSNLIDTNTLSDVYQKMSLIRKIELKIAEIYPTDAVKSPVHLSIGQEAPSVGVCAALNTEDMVFGTYRGHALYIARGGNLNAMVAELFGKITGCGKGKAGSMHLVAPEVNMMGTSAVVATSIPQAVGHALADKMKGHNRVTVVFFGDGAMEEGVFHESMNFAALHELPVIFICENNGLAIFTPLETRVANTDFCSRASSYGMDSHKIINNNVVEAYEKTREIADTMRADGKGPFFLEIETYRWFEHVGPGEDWQRNYRDSSLRQKWIDNDEMERIGQQLPAKQREQIDADNLVAMEAAFRFAEESPYPDEDELLRDVYA